MRWYLDTEFNTNAERTELISIGLLSEDERVGLHLALNEGWSADDCDPWVVKNVLPFLPPRRQWVSRERARDAIKVTLQTLGCSAVVTYYGSFDWYLFCQLFGGMMSLPKGCPQYPLDIVQEMVRLHIPKSSLPPQAGTAHNALEDARWNRSAWLALEEISKTRDDIIAKNARGDMTPVDLGDDVEPPAL